MGGHHRGHKMIKAVAARGWKMGKAAIKRGHKFLKDTVKSVGDADTLARKAANTFSAMGDYAQLGGDLTGHPALHNAGEAFHNLGQSIHNVRRGALANRIRSDFGGAPGVLSRSIMKEKMD